MAKKSGKQPGWQTYIISQYTIYHHITQLFHMILCGCVVFVPGYVCKIFTAAALYSTWWAGCTVRMYFVHILNTVSSGGFSYLLGRHAVLEPFAFLYITHLLQLLVNWILVWMSSLNLMHRDDLGIQPSFGISGAMSVLLSHFTSHWSSIHTKCMWIPAGLWAMKVVGLRHSVYV